MRAKRLLALILTVAIAMSCGVTAFAEGETEVTEETGSVVEVAPVIGGSGTEEDPYIINNVEDLISFRDSVNAGETTYNAENVWVALGADIDMTGVDWSVNIGDDCNATFDGIFDGRNHTISNLTSVETAQKSDVYICTGLFGAIYGSAQIKNLNIENVTIDACNFEGNNIGVVVGFAYSATGAIENVKVCGDIKVNAPGGYGVGAIVGYAYSGNLTVKNCSVEANDGSYIKAISGVGGIIGYGGTADVAGASVENLAISANGLMGGVAGLLLQGGSATGCSVSDVEFTVNDALWINSVAVAVGTIASSNGIAVSDVEGSGVSVNGTAVTRLVGSTYTEKPSEVVPAVVAKIGDAYYTSLAEAVTAADGKTVTLVGDVILSDMLTVSSGKTVAIDLAGYTISQTKEQTAGYQMILNDGNLTINDSVGGGKISYTDIGNGGEYISDTIYNRATLVINGGTVENLSSATVASNGYPHAVDTYSGIRDTSVAINGGTIYCAQYSAIRMFCVSATHKADLVINGGTVKGAVDMQNGTSAAALGSLTINGGTFKTTANVNNIRFANWNGGAAGYGITAKINNGSFDGGITTAYVPAAANWDNKIISGGTFTQDVSDFVADGYEFDSETGTVVEATPAPVTVASAGELQAALDNYTAGTAIQLVENVNYGVVYLRPSPDNPSTKGNTDVKFDWTGNNYGYESVTVFENMTIIGAEGSVIDAIEIEGGQYYNTEHSQSELYPVMCSLIELKNVTLDGITFTGKGGYDPQGHGNVLNFAGNNIKVNGLTVQNCVLNDEADNARLIYKTESTTAAWDCICEGEDYIFVSSLADITVKDCTFNGGYMGLELRETENLTIEGNTFNGVTSRDILLPTNSGCTYKGEIKIIGNISDGAGDRFVRASGIGNATLIIKDNEIVNYKGSDDDFIKADAVTGTYTVENNRFDGVVVEFTTDDNGLVSVVKPDSSELTLSGSGTEEDPYLINNIDELKWFRDDVNSGNTYDDKYIKLTADIDLNNENWTPIGTSANVFCGSFNGSGKTISNLKLDGDKTYVSGGNNDNYKGLFGYMKGGNNSAIRNLNINNVSVTGCLYVGTVLGRSYTGGIIENCHVTGDVFVDGYSYIGGIVGRHDYSAGLNANGVKMAIYDCSVKDTNAEAGIINGDYAVTYIGGIVGFMGEGNYVIDSCAVENVNVSGIYGVGGISGIGHYGNVISGSSVNKITVISTNNEADSNRTNNIGLIAGATQGEASSPTVFRGNTVTESTGSVTYTDGTTGEISAIYGNAINGTTPVTNYVAEIGNNQYETLAEALAAAVDGNTIELLNDIALDNTLIFSEAGTFVINGNGKSVTLANGFTNTNANAAAIVLGTSGTGDDVDVAYNYTIKNVVFDGISGSSIIRAEGVTLAMEGCTVKNCNMTSGNGGLFRLESTTSNIINTSFVDNTTTNGYGIISQNYNSDNSESDMNVENCVFDGNNVVAAGVIYVNAGDEAVIKNSKFTGNSVTTDGNAATVYLGWGSGQQVSGCVFEENSITTSHATTKRFASAIFCDGCIVNENAFINNTATRNGETISTAVAVGAYYGEANISANYWNDGTEPVEGEVYTVEYTRKPVTNDSYYQTRNEDGTLTDIVSLAKVAKIGDVEYATLAEAIADVNEGETISILSGTISEGAIKLPSTLKNVTIKGEEGAVLKDMTVMAADGNSFDYDGLTFDGITFENSRILITGWRNNGANIKNLTVTNCIFKDLYDETNSAPVHINVDETEAVENFTFTNNVIDGATGGQKSGIYMAATGNVTVTGNTFNNIVFRPALIQLADCDGTVDNVVVSDNTFSNTTRLQIYGSEEGPDEGPWIPSGTDVLAIEINKNIFQNISGYYICTWGINGEADIAENYYDSTDLGGKIYWNNEKPADEAALADIGIYPIYTDLNDDGTINLESRYAYVPDYVVFPDGMDSSNYFDLFGDNTVTDGVNYYATIKDALFGIHLTDNRVLYCKPGADVGVMTHGHLCDDLTVYGNGAKLTASGEQDFEVDTYKFCHSSSATCTGLTEDITLAVKHLDGCGAWGQRTSDKTVNLVFENCKDMNRVYINGTSGDTNITLTDCSFLGTVDNRCTLYSNANGTIAVSNTEFANIYAPINLNHKVAGTQTVVIDNCSFDNCGTAEYDYAAPIRVLSSVEGAISEVTVSGVTFNGTVANKVGQNADILLDYGVGTTNATVSGTAANVVVETENNVGEVEVTTAEEEYSFTNAVENYVAKIGDVEYVTLAEAITAATNGDTILLIDDLTDIGDAFVGGKTVTIDGNGHTVSGESRLGASYYSTTGDITFKNINFKDITPGKKWSAIMINHLSGTATIDNCTFTNVEWDDIQVASNKTGAKVVITNCTFDGKGARGIHIQPTAAENAVMDITVEGNKFYYDEEADASSIGIWFPAATTTFAIDKNYVENPETISITVIDAQGENVNVSEEAMPLYDETLTTPISYVAKVVAADSVYGNVFYTDLQTAVNEATAGDTITVIADITYTGSNRVTIDGKALTVDLGGYTVTGEHVVFNIKNGADVTLKNGTVCDVSKDTNSAIQLFGGKAHLASDLTVQSGNTAVGLYGTNDERTVLTTEAVLISSDDATIAGQGNYDGTVINIIGGKITSESNIAIYHPQDGTLNISGGELSGTTGIVLKSGSLNITGGTIEAKGEETAYEYVTSGWISTGDALVIENIGADTGYQEIGTVSITGGKLVSANANAVASYGVNDAEAVNGFISGGTFSSDVSDYCAEGYTCEANADGTYGIQEVEETVTPFKDAPLFLAGIPDETIDGIVYHPVYMATSIDSLNYRKVGFDYTFSIFDPETNEVTFTAPYTTETSEVYSSISDATTTYTVESIGGKGKYLFMNKLLFNAAYYHNNNTKITITPYAIDTNGNKITGWTFDMTNEFYKSLQSGDVKQDMFKEEK